MATFPEFLRRTPFHPQWLALRQNHFGFALVTTPSKGDLVLDIGCGRGELRQYLPAGVHYIGFDYPATGISRYHAKPELLGSADALPLSEGSIDIVICLEVMEHLSDPESAAKEIARVLRSGGHAAISVPFAYPIHDAPFDYQRMTSYQLKRIFESNGLQVESLEETGHALESASLLYNLSLAKTVLDGIKARKPVALLLPWLMLQVPVINLLGWLTAKFAGNHGKGFLPMGYRLHLKKP